MLTRPTDNNDDATVAYVSLALRKFIDLVSVGNWDRYFVQESPADAGVSARQSRHLAINFELGFPSTIESVLTCAATWRKR